jgi:pimeloyl-ACP methyl ester carboxylesterase
MLKIDAAAARDRINASAEFHLAARDWNCVLVLDLGSSLLRFAIRDGRIEEAGGSAGDGSADLRLAAPEAYWRELLRVVPRPGHQALPWGDRFGFRFEGDDIGAFFPYYGAVRCIVEVLRELVSGPSPEQTLSDVERGFDDAVGRYAYIRVDGVQYRVYFEETGRGIPILLQHTAGSDGRQWRHLLESRELQQDFRMIAYDLPYHGKSLPPTGVRWWEQEYRLTRSFLMATVLALSRALGLDRPVYMGCSIGGHLAPDLAYYHPDEFRAVIGVNAGIHTPVDPAVAASWAHPRIGNQWKASAMLSPMSPTSPEAYRRETAWMYSQGAPSVFTGDVYYYGRDHDLTGLASQIDTARIPVYLLTGEYDPLNAPDGTAELARQVPGARFQLVEGMGHFGASENPEQFIKALRPVLDEIRRRQEAGARR